MEQQQQFFSGMPAPEVNAEELHGALQNVLKHTAASGAPALEMFAQLQQRRAGRLTEMAATLRQKLGKDHPQVIAVENAAKSVGELKTRLDVGQARLKRWPKPRANEWVVFGTVTEAEGKPASGLTVRVFDRDRKYDDLLGETETDENGDFAVTYHERDFAEVRENLPDLYVMIQDGQGQLLYSSRNSVRYEAGRVEYFRIVLRAAPPGATKTAPKSKPSSEAPITRKTQRK